MWIVELGAAVEKELQKLIGQQVPIKTRTGGRMMEFITEVYPDVVILATNADGTGRRTLLAVQGHTMVSSLSVRSRVAAGDRRFRALRTIGRGKGEAHRGSSV